MKKIFLFFLACSISILMSGQMEINDWNAELPLDPAVKIGKLDNGLTYYIRQNKKPENRAEFYLVVNAGSILENDDQNGLAHFCEHMAFNGTANFEKKQIINYLQSIGMKFGPEINAFTSQDVTTYMLQKVPMEDPEHIDTSLMILYDWAYNISFEDEEIDAERGVLHEEWRTSRGAEFRMMTKAYKVLYKDSKYADRDVIGDINIIDKAPYETLKSFYRDWYRPDLQAIIAVGDFDPAVIETKIIELFSKAQAPQTKREREYFPVPDHPGTLVTIQTDKEARYPMVQIYYKHDPVKEKKMKFFRDNMLEGLYSTMINARLNELLQSENPPFVYSYAGNNSVVKTKDAYISFALAKEGEIDRAVRALVEENERVRRFGFTETELQRAKDDMMVNLEKEYKERDKQESDNYVWAYFSHFLNQDPIPGIEFHYAFAQSVMSDIKVEEINDLAKQWLKDDNRVIVIMSPEKEGMIIPSEADLIAIMNAATTMELTAYVDKVSDAPLVAEEPTPAPVAKKKENKELGSVEWTFNNGVKVVLKQTDFKEDEIMMSAFSFGGTSLYEINDLVSAQQASSVIGESGIGQFDQIELQKKLSGKVVYLNPFISGTTEEFSGSTTPNDLETMLQLLYLYFTAPRFDETAFNSYIQRMQSMLENKKLDPRSALMDTLSVTMANYNPRVRPMTSELLKEADLKKIEWIYRERFGDPSGFTFYFVGNIDPEKVQPLFEKYIGGLPKITRMETFSDNGVRPPAGVVEKEIKREMQVPKGTVSINFTGTFDYDNYQDRINLSSLVDILNVVYVETVREEEGGTYGVSVMQGMNKYPYESYTVRIFFDCDPGNTDKLSGVIYREIEKLKTAGPTMKDLNGVKENKLKKYEENLKENNYWLNVLKNVDFEGYDPKLVSDYPKYIENLSIESLKDAANMFFGGNIVQVTMTPTNMDDNVVNPMIENK